jgi:uncharacterized protein YgiM (DUF1202 family)
MRRFRFVSLVALLLVATVCAAQQQAAVVHNVNLRSDPSTHHPPISSLLPGEVLQLVETDQTNGYYHVRTTDGTDGWVWGRNVTTQGSSNSGGAGSSNTPDAAISTSWDKPAPVSNTLLGEEGSCSQTGDGGDIYPTAMTACCSKRNAIAFSA